MRERNSLFVRVAVGVLDAEAGLDGGGVAGHHAGEGADDGVDVVGVDAVHQIGLGHVPVVAAEHTPVGVAHLMDLSGAVEEGDDVGTGLQHRGQQAFACGQGPLRFHPGRDVRGDAPHGVGRPVLVEQEKARHPEVTDAGPGVEPVVGHLGNPGDQKDPFVLGDGGGVGGPAVAGGRPHHVLDGHAGDPGPLPIDDQVAALEILHVDGRGRILEDGLEAGFVVAQGLVGVPVLGDVAPGAVHPAPGRVGPHRPFERPPCAVAAPGPGPDARHLVARGQGGTDGGDDRQVVGVDEVSEIGTDQRAGVVAQDPGHRVVAPHDRALQIEHAQDLGRVLDERRHVAGTAVRARRCIPVVGASRKAAGGRHGSVSGGWATDSMTRSSSRTSIGLVR
jgi:hypothetical protein